jgi:sensor histidine kinase YesM
MTAPPSWYSRIMEKAIQRRWVQHLLFWMVSFYFLLRFFAYEEVPSKADWIYTFLFHLSLFAGVYLNLNSLIPRLLRARRYLLYILSLSILLAGATLLNIITFEYLADWIFPGYYFISYYTPVDILQFMIIYIGLTSLLKLSKGWFQLQEKERRIAQLEKGKLDAELRALKAQLDPHFLLNSLNNLYSLALDKDRRTPEILLKLSESVRYMLYECSPRFVPLQREIDHIRNYVSLQQLRCGARAEIRLEVDGTIVDQQQIAPLLFLPIIENAFKHGLSGKRDNPFIRIRIQVEENGIHCRVANSRGTADTSLLKSPGGIGLKNLQKRLQLIYPGAHHLEIREDGDTYLVHLKILDL